MYMYEQKRVTTPGFTHFCIFSIPLTLKETDCTFTDYVCTSLYNTWIVLWFRSYFVTAIVKNNVYYSHYTHKDYYIGLRQTNETACACCDASTNTENCETYRASWSWSDDSTPMAWWNWQPGEPDESTCGRKTESGWAANDCDVELRFICQQGEVLALTCSLFSMCTCNLKMYMYVHKSLVTLM